MVVLDLSSFLVGLSSVFDLKLFLGQLFLGSIVLGSIFEVFDVVLLLADAAKELQDVVVQSLLHAVYDILLVDLKSFGKGPK